MRYWFRGKRGGLIVFLGVVVLVVGGLGWVTAEALQLEREQLAVRGQAAHSARVQLALTLLDGRVRPVLAREDSRPYNHYSAIFAPSVAFTNTGAACQPGTVLEPSPLLHAELPDWMLLHFQAEEESGWCSPQVLSPTMLQRLPPAQFKFRLLNATPRRSELLRALDAHLSPRKLLDLVQQHGARPIFRDSTLLPPTNPADNLLLIDQVRQQQLPVDPGYLKRLEQASKVAKEVIQGNNPELQPMDPDAAMANLSRSGADWLANREVRRKGAGEPVEVVLSPLIPMWLEGVGDELQLVVVRLVRLGNRQACQGIVLDWPRLREILVDEVDDLFPEACIEPVLGPLTPQPEQTRHVMTALPLQLDPGPPQALMAARWTPLRIGLSLAWVAALVALGAVGLGGWSLLELSERRIRFVSAVTHELRTPLTTLRLYLDMLTSGMVQQEQQRQEYLATLHDEAERLNRLVGNVLAFSRLENQRPQVARRDVPVTELLDPLRAVWEGRCTAAGKELVVENGLDDGAVVHTDPELVQQILGNLIDNACKYSQGAADGHIWVRATRPAAGRLVLEVEDRGPGVPSGERRVIFRPFRRGKQTPATAGGVGLGLALAQRWAQLLGGTLTLCGGDHPGACFHLELPMSTNKGVVPD